MLPWAKAKVLRYESENWIQRSTPLFNTMFGRIRIQTKALDSNSADFKFKNVAPVLKGGVLCRAALRF
jgi:hypothetical protein